MTDDPRNDELELEPDFTDQSLLSDPTSAPGPNSSDVDDPVGDGDEVYFPPTDPVITTDAHGRTQVLGGFSPTSTDSLEVEPSAEDSLLGDEAIADAIRRELHEDATTTDLEVEIQVEQGTVYLRGTVNDLDDADNAEAVAARVPGVIEVRETLEVVSA